MRSRLAVFFRLLFPLLALIASLPQSALALTASQVYEQVKDSVVVVKAHDQTGKLVSMGSGVMLPSGDIITNYHVVKAGVRYTVGRGTKGTPATSKEGEVFDIPNYWVPATIEASDPKKDLCLLTAPGLAAKPARLGQAVKLKVGDKVYAVGAPQGLELSLSEGIVSQLRGDPPPLIQTTVAISKGSSGGGLFNAEGELVGITTFYLKDSQSLNFALPVEWIGQMAGKKIQERPRGETPGATIPGARPQAGWAKRADALVEAEDWQGLLAHCRRWTQAEPGDAEAWYSLGVAYWEISRYGDAIEASKKAIRLKPNYPQAWNNLGNSYVSLGFYRWAIVAYGEALRLKPDFPQAWYGLGGSYARSGNRSAALGAVKELRRYDPQKADELFHFIMKP
ncbi:MAG: trypsin-like peptidase domain-containing protein [Desulfobaccales bacterium]